MTHALTERIEHPWPRRLLRSMQFGFARLTSRDGYVVARSAPFGLTFKGPAADVITRHIYRLGAHEPVITRYLLENVRLDAGDIALDVGANLGWYSVLLNRLSAPGAQIFSFEPDPRTYGLLLSNLAANEATRVKPFNIALGAQAGTATLRRYKDSNNGRHSLIPGDDIAGSITVPLETLDAFAATQGIAGRRIAFMKIDVEGFEYFVLRGATQLLQQCQNIVCEYSPQSLALAGEPPDALIELLKASGMSARGFIDGVLRPISFAELAQVPEQLDLLLTHA